MKRKLAFFTMVGCAFLVAQGVFGQEQKPGVAVAPLAALGEIDEAARGIVFNNFLATLSRSYRLVPQEEYRKAEEAAFASLSVEQCTEEYCIRKIKELLQVERLVVLQIIRSGAVTQLTATLVRDEDRIVRAETCRGCDVFALNEKVGALVAEITAADLGRQTPPPATSVAAATVRLPSPEMGQIWREPITGMEFVFVAGGSYEQGCGSWTSDCDQDEKPVRKVRLSPFWLGRTEVTQGQWRGIMRSNPSRFQGNDRPVEQVSWDDAQEFLRRLNARSRGVTFRLPSEPEWEYACRAGGKPVAYGTDSGSLARFKANFGRYEGGPTPVGNFPPNGLGLHDMTGNVLEWTVDVYSEKAYAGGSARDPVYAGSGANRVFRGGGWYSRPRRARCSDRHRYAPANPYGDIGFRLAKAP